jgi:hypothetical protein
VAAVAAVSIGLAGCASSAGTSPAGSTGTAAPAVSAALDIGLCGSEAADDLDTALGITGLQQVSANPLRCAWAGTGDPAATGYRVVFAWFRGSSLAERRDQVSGQATTVTVAGRSGIAWSGPASCEVAVDSGGQDFVDWTLVGAGGDQQCAALRQLAATTLAKAG